MNRRHFLVVLGSAAAATVVPESTWAADGPSDGFEVIDIGSLDQFEQDKVYDDHRDQGFFIIRRANEVFALSSICTHKGCKVRAQDDQSFLCKCHKSVFNPNGKVLNGPATADLPRLKVKLSAERHVLVRLPKKALL